MLFTSRVQSLAAGPAKEESMHASEVPDIVVGRLPIYLRALAFLAEEGRTVTSSQELGERLGISPAQIRKDLSYFGGFGKQGTGYEIANLVKELRRILKIEKVWDVVLVGAGDLGRALVHYGGVVGTGFRITHIFDNNPRKIGQKIGDLEIMDSASLPEVIKENKIQVAIVAVPPGEAQRVVETLVDAGIRAILNYAPITINVPPHVRIQHIDPVIGLQHMTYYLQPD
jgi:redox-sensing transcriptional repressor